MFILNWFVIAVKQDFQNFPTRKLRINQQSISKTTVYTPSAGKIRCDPFTCVWQVNMES